MHFFLTWKLGGSEVEQWLAITVYYC